MILVFQIFFSFYKISKSFKCIHTTIRTQGPSWRTLRAGSSGAWEALRATENRARSTAPSPLTPVYCLYKHSLRVKTTMLLQLDGTHPARSAHEGHQPPGTNQPVPFFCSSAEAPHPMVWLLYSDYCSEWPWYADSGCLNVGMSAIPDRGLLQKGGRPSPPPPQAASSLLRS